MEPLIALDYSHFYPKLQLRKLGLFVNNPIAQCELLINSLALTLCCAAISDRGFVFRLVAKRLHFSEIKKGLAFN